MVSKTYQWALVPEDVSISDKRDILLQEGFADDGDNEFLIEVMNWKSFRAKVKKDEILFSFYWPGSSITSKFYDYLVRCGMIIQRIKYRMSMKPVKQLETDDE